MISMEAQSIRVVVFFGVLALCIIAEKLRPILAHQYSARLRTNLLLFVCMSIALKICFPLGLYSLAHFIAQTPSLISFAKLPFALDLLLTVLVFDLCIYVQHRLMHVFGFLWRFHKVHHSDMAMDFSTAIRFHPGEAIISGMYKIGILFIIAPRAETYLIYEMILNGMALFNHSNFTIAPKLDKCLRMFIVTPTMHTPHHHPLKEHTNSNYGNFLSLWDKLFKSYNSYINHEKFGIEEIKEEEANKLSTTLLLPFQ